MKLIVSLSSLALISFSNVAPSLAAIQSISRSTQPPMSSPAIPTPTQPVQVARFRDVLRGINQGLTIIEQQKRLAEQRRLRKELAEARRKATEQQLLEADRLQKHFESLSPEEQQAYLAEQRARSRAQQDRSAAIFVMMGTLLLGGGSGTTQPDEDDRECRNSRVSRSVDGTVYDEKMTARQARQYGLVCN